MPKDAKKNIDRYKIGGGHLNEFEFHKNQQEFVESQASGLNQLIPGTPPQAKTQQLKQVRRKAQQLATKKPQKAVEIRGASAKKLAARKAAKK